MARFDRGFVESQIAYLFRRERSALVARRPVNLQSLARIQGVRIVDIRPMVPTGGITPIPGGFKVFIQDLEAVDSLCHELSQEADPLPLSPRQRFSFAHEIVHTFFYDHSKDTPVRLKGAPRGRGLENLCQEGARSILLPEDLISKDLTHSQPVTSHFALELAERYEASAPVVIRRLDALGELKSSDSALIMAEMEESGEDAKIVAACYATSLLAYRPRPEPYSSLLTWWGKPLNDNFFRCKHWSAEDKASLGIVQLRKVSYAAESFFFEIQIIHE